MRGRLITASGGKFDLLDPRPEDVRLHDIAQSLSQQCRYRGHTSTFYSVAEHCVRLAQHAEAVGLDRIVQQVALLHDAEEAYVGDIPAPQLQVGLPGGDVLEVDLAAAVVRVCIFEALGLDPLLANYRLRLPVVHQLDLRIRADEVQALFPPSCAWAAEGVEPLGVFGAGAIAAGWPPDEARDVFLLQARTLGFSA